MTLTPAYSRRYASRKAVLADFNSGKDFLCHFMLDPVKPINREQIARGTRVQFRYGSHVFSYIVQ